jgi:hypothetical protein
LSPQKKLKFAFTHGEIVRLYEEIGDLPMPRVGPKLLEFYRQLGSVIKLQEAKPARKRGAV